MPFHHLSKNAGLVLAPRMVGLSKFLPTFLPIVASLAALTNLPEVDQVPEGGELTLLTDSRESNPAPLSITRFRCPDLFNGL